MFRKLSLVLAFLLVFSVMPVMVQGFCQDNGDGTVTDNLRGSIPLHLRH